MLSTTKSNSKVSPMQLIEKAQSFSEDDDLLSPFDTGEVEAQIKRAWWKTCSLFTFLLATLGIIMFIIIRDNNNHGNDSSKNQININQRYTVGSALNNNNNNNIDKELTLNFEKEKEKKDTKIENKDSNTFLSQRGELPTSMASSVVGSRVTMRKLYDPSSKNCVTSVMDTLIETGDLDDDMLTLSMIESGFTNILDTYGTLSLKEGSSIKEYVTKSSELGYYSNKLNKDFEIKSLTINAKSDALVFVISINWESTFGNKLPYITSKVITMKYDHENCQISALMPISFTECFNGKCNSVREHDSVVVSYLKTLVEEKKA